MAHYETIDGDGLPMRVCLSSPSGGGEHPAMIVMCHGAGLDAFGEDVCDRLAEAGLVAAAPDVFHRQPDVADSAVKRANMIDRQIVDDINRTIALLISKGTIDRDRVGIIGHCMGGRMALLGACADRRMKACVDFYGGNCMVSWGGEEPAPFERIGSIRCPVLGLFGNSDENPSPEDVDKIDAEMNRCGIDHEFHRYDGAGHAFQNFLNKDSYRADISKDGWNKVLAFLGHQLG